MAEMRNMMRWLALPLKVLTKSPGKNGINPAAIKWLEGMKNDNTNNPQEKVIMLPVKAANQDLAKV